MVVYKDINGSSIKLGMEVISSNIPSDIKLDDEGICVISNEYFNEKLVEGINECEIINFDRNVSCVVPFAEETDIANGWILDYSSLKDIAKTIETETNCKKEEVPTLKLIETVLLASSDFEKLMA